MECLNCQRENDPDYHSRSEDAPAGILTEVALQNSSQPYYTEASEASLDYLEEGAER